MPQWVEHEPYGQPPSGSAADAFVDNRIFRILEDTQNKVAAEGLARHVRRVQRVLTRAGAELVANFAAEFNPAFERLEVHFIRVVRGEQRIEHAHPDRFQLLRREKQLERLALNGRLTASFLIPDVRVDDVLEIALTVYGGPPVLQRSIGRLGMFALRPLLMRSGKDVWELTLLGRLR